MKNLERSFLKGFARFIYQNKPSAYTDFETKLDQTLHVHNSEQGASFDSKTLEVVETERSKTLEAERKNEFKKILEKVPTEKESQFQDFLASKLSVFFADANAYDLAVKTGSTFTNDIEDQTLTTAEFSTIKESLNNKIIKLEKADQAEKDYLTDHHTFFAEKNKFFDEILTTLSYGKDVSDLNFVITNDNKVSMHFDYKTKYTASFKTEKAAKLFASLMERDFGTGEKIDAKIAKMKEKKSSELTEVDPIMIQVSSPSRFKVFLENTNRPKGVVYYCGDYMLYGNGRVKVTSGGKIKMYSVADFLKQFATQLAEPKTPVAAASTSTAEDGAKDETATVTESKLNEKKYADIKKEYFNKEKATAVKEAFNVAYDGNWNVKFANLLNISVADIITVQKAITAAGYPIVEDGFVGPQTARAFVTVSGGTVATNDALYSANQAHLTKYQQQAIDSISTLYGEDTITGIDAVSTTLLASTGEKITQIAEGKNYKINGESGVSFSMTLAGDEAKNLALFVTPTHITCYQTIVANHIYRSYENKDLVTVDLPATKTDINYAWLIGEFGTMIDPVKEADTE